METKQDNLLDHFSVSSLGTYERCNIQWYFRYVLGKKVPPSGVLTLGKSFHQAEEKNFKQKIDSGVDLPTESVLSDFSDRFDANMEETELKQDEDKGTLKDSGVKTLEVFHEEAAVNIHPLKVEQEFQVEIGGYNFKAIIDLIDKYNAIRDLKTSGKTPSEADIQYSQQLTAYQLVYKKIYGENPSKLWLDYAIRLKKKPKVLQCQVEPRSQDQLQIFEEEAALKREAIVKGVFIPAKPDSWVCSEKYCGFFNQCKYGARRHKRVKK